MPLQAKIMFYLYQGNSVSFGAKADALFRYADLIEAMSREETGIDDSGPEGGLGFGIRIMNYPCKYGIKIHNCRDD